MTTEKHPVEDSPDFDAKEVEAQLKEQEKENLEGVSAADKKTDDGQTKYAGGPIPR